MDNQAALSEINKLKAKLDAVQLPAQLMEKAVEQIERINLSLKYGGNLSQLDVTTKYIDLITNLPWNARTQDILDINRVKETLDKNHFGLEKIKSRIMEYMSILIMQKQRLNAELFHAPSLFFVGLAGTGKTTFAISLAEALGRRFIRIPFGGLSSALDLRGQSKLSPESEPGMVIKALRRVGSRNPVILLDELDRVAPETRTSVMGVLLELLDPGQNRNFTDYFLDYPFDLSEVIFVATANNTSNVATAVLDRLELIQMPSYTDEEKIHIGKNYILPKYLKEVGLTPDMVRIEDSVWVILIRALGFEPGIRSLERLIETLVRKIAFKIVSGQGTQFAINETNMREYVPL
ncbi:AAA family ATPase [Candidatus Roizmanbacteria bacterium]|nr:AAA family ATPase [Candidatus Roizmanbacteria bacterium]